jgi:hypothetical protein
MAGEWIERVRSLLEAPSPAVLTTYRKDASALDSPVWFRRNDGAFDTRRCPQARPRCSESLGSGSLLPAPSTT